jgi:hypothetical protein
LVGNALEQEIVSLYSDNLSSLFSINQIASMLGKKYPYINKKVTILIKNKIFKKMVVGRSYLCSLNLQNDETIYLLVLNEIRKKRIVLKNNTRLEKAFDYIYKISQLTDAEIVLYFKEKIVFVMKSNAESDQLAKSILKEALHGIEFETMTKEKLLQAVIDDKSLHEDKTILLGFEKYYGFIREIEDELKVRYSKLLP